MSYSSVSEMVKDLSSPDFAKGFEKSLKRANKVTQDAFRQIILQMCQEPKSIQEIAAVIHRHPVHLRRQYVDPLIKEGLLLIWGEYTKKWGNRKYYKTAILNRSEEQPPIA